MANVEDTTGRDTLLKAADLKTGHMLDIGMGGCACMAFYKHKHDAARLLASIEREARKLGAAIQTTDIRLDRLFVCSKE